MPPTPDQIATVGRAVRRRRAELGLTRQQLAEAAGVDPKTVWGLESGKRWPQTETRVALERALQWPDDQLDALLGNDVARAPKSERETLAKVFSDIIRLVLHSDLSEEHQVRVIGGVTDLAETIAAEESQAEPHQAG